MGMSAIVKCDRCGESRDNDGPHECNPDDVADCMGDRIDDLAGLVEELIGRVARLTDEVAEFRVQLRRVDQQSDPRFLGGDPRDAGYNRR